VREVVIPPVQEVVGICKQISNLILHPITSRLTAPLKLIYSSIQVNNVLVLTVSCNLINFVFQIVLLFVPEMAAGFMSYIVQIIPIYFALMLKPLQFGLYPLIQ
jgi:hypothetical protein